MDEDDRAYVLDRSREYAPLKKWALDNIKDTQANLLHLYLGTAHQEEAESIVDALEAIEKRIGALP